MADPTLFPDGTYEIVDITHLPSKTAAGYRLVRIIDGPSTPLFLLTQHRDETHEELRDTIRKLEQEKRAFDRRIYDMDRESDAQDRLVERLREDTAASEKEIASNAAELERLRQNCASYENLVAALRKQMGEGAWKEATKKA